MTRQNFYKLRAVAVFLILGLAICLTSNARAHTAMLFIFGHYKIASENMQPTLEVNDHVFSNGLAYSTKNLPKHGDVVVFRNPNSGQVFVKRLVGLPGDEVQTTHGRLYLNGKMIERTKIDEFSYRTHRGWPVQVIVYSEQLPGEKLAHLIFEQFDDGMLDNAGPFAVPAGHYFVMGDNCDNSADSRMLGGPGFVPFDHLIGRAEMMVFSFKKCKTEEGLHCPGSRWFLKL